MAQLFLWTQKIDDSLRASFADRFGFAIPEPLLDLHENLPEEVLHFLRYFPMRDIVSEVQRPPQMMPGLVPFAEEGDGDMYCFYLPWKDRDGSIPIGIWLHETGHFLPISSHMQGFLLWWMGKELLDAVSSDDWDEMSKVVELFRSGSNLDEYDLMSSPPASPESWHEEIIRIDGNASFSLTYLAVSQFATHGFQQSQRMLADAEKVMPRFGAASLWQARMHAMRGRVNEAHKAYWRHLRTPMFANGYHYWWHAGDMKIPEVSELEAADFLEGAELPPPAEIANHPKMRFLRDSDPRDYQARLKLSRLLEQRGDVEGALVELENAFFLQSWDDNAAREMLERLLYIYPEHNRLREAEQCRRALARLNHKASSPG